MKILIVSDTHGKNDNLEKVLAQENNIDMLLHLGDIEGSELFFSKSVKGPVKIVAGNNDFFSSFEKEKEIIIGKFKILMTHGHYYYVSTGFGQIYKEARGRGIDVFMFGHTHRPFLETKQGITLINPGSLSYPRQEGHLPSYAIMEIGQKDTLTFQIKYLEK